MNEAPMAVIMPPMFAPPAAAKPSDRGEHRFALALTCAFLAAGAVLAWNHELGHDEIQGWLIGKDCLTSSDVVAQSCRHGRAPFWQLGIHAVTRAFSDLVFLQMIHLLIAASGVYLFARWAPFGRWARALFAFGYFPLFEFGVVCQGHVLSMALLFAVCALFPHRNDRFGWFAFLVFLLGQSSLAGFVMAGAVTAGCAIEWCRAQVMPSRKRLILGSACLAVSLVLFGIQQAQSPWRSTSGFDAGTLLTRAFLPIPDLTVHFWDSSLLNVPGATRGLHVLLTGVLLAWCTLVLMRRPSALAMFLISAAAMATLVLCGAPVTRPGGFVFLSFVAAAWMAQSASAFSPDAISPRLEHWRGLAWSPVFLNLLVIQLVAGGVAAYFDGRYAFSCGRETARFLRAHQLENAVIVGTDPAAAVTVSGYLGKKLYNPVAEEFGSYAVTSKEDRVATDMSDLSQKVNRLSRAFRRQVVILLGEPLDEVVEKAEGLTKLGSFTNGVIARERYHLYVFPLPDDVRDATRPIERLVMNWSR